MYGTPTRCLGGGIRTLATKTQNSTQEIETMIGSLQTDADKAVKTIDESKKLSDKSVEMYARVECDC